MFTGLNKIRSAYFEVKDIIDRHGTKEQEEEVEKLTQELMAEIEQYMDRMNAIWDECDSRRRKF